MINLNQELRSAAGLPEGFEGPRGSILVELKRDGALSAKSLAARLGLSLNAIRHHLRELERMAEPDGYLSFFADRSAMAVTRRAVDLAHGPESALVLRVWE